jgi:hypothetical protein
MPDFKFFKRKKRRYPIKFDEERRSARSRCLELFAQKVPDQEIAAKVGVPLDTVRKYRLQWKKDPGFERKYLYVKSLFHKTNPDRDKNLELFASAWGLTKEQLNSILTQSHGLQRLLARKIQTPAQAKADRKRHIALELALLISDHLVEHGGKYEDVYYSLQRWMQDNRRYRENKEDDIKEWNEKMQLFHNIIKSEVKLEREGRTKPDVFSQEECQEIIRIELKSQFKKLQTIYWQNIAGLMGGGLTEDQAQQKMRQELLTTDSRAAKVMREFLDKIHPLAKKDQKPPPPQPPPPPQ